MRAHCVLQYIYGDGQTPPRGLSFPSFRVSVAFCAASNRMGAAVLGIFGNSKEEAIYPAYYVDADGRKTDDTNRYILRFAKDQLPPA